MESLNYTVPALLLILIGWKWKLPFVFTLILWILASASNSLFFRIVNLDGSLLILLFRILFPVLITFILLLVSLLILFFRNPERAPSTDSNVILCPADGIVRYIRSFGPDGIVEIKKHGRKIKMGQVANESIHVQSGVHIGIEMRVIDVHVNRSPVDGIIVQQKRYPGAFRSLRDLKALMENERVVTLINNQHFQIVMIQIASRLVRRIITYVAEGEFVQRGQRIGMIRFGSQVDLILPEIKGLTLLIRKDQKVKAGETIIATYHNSNGEV